MTAVTSSVRIDSAWRSASWMSRAFTTRSARKRILKRRSVVPLTRSLARAADTRGPVEGVAAGGAASLAAVPRSRVRAAPAYSTGVNGPSGALAADAATTASEGPLTPAAVGCVVGVPGAICLPRSAAPVPLARAVHGRLRDAKRTRDLGHRRCCLRIESGHFALLLIAELARRPSGTLHLVGFEPPFGL